MPVAEALDAMATFAPAGCVGVIRRAFDRMEICEEEMEKAKRKHPLKAKQIHSSFLCFRPDGHFDDVPDHLYRAHCKEILARIVNEVDIIPATKSEVLWQMHKLSQMAPPSSAFSFLFERLFKEVLPEEYKKIKGGEGQFREDWPNQANEMLAQFQRKLRVENRGKDI